MGDEFNKLSTVQFQEKMTDYAVEIYEKVFPECIVEYLDNGDKAHDLDKYFGIDGLIRYPDGNFITFQEKFRENEYLKYEDFTQEYKNAEGTPFIRDGEWFNLAAQVYFYGWANADNTGFEKWAIFDIVKYKILINKYGGINKVGKKQSNKKHGAASFYCIPIKNLRSCFISDYSLFNKRQLK